MNVVRASSEGDISCESKNSGNTSGLYSIITKRLKLAMFSGLTFFGLFTSFLFQES